MANKDLITEQILSIEDFNNVDAGLMRIIESNDEYRRIFEEYKEISKLTSECIPEPVKNGVSLHEAVMNRVKSGDTTPRYTQGSTGRKFMFPMATAASLAIVLVAAITATVVTKTRDSRDISDAIDNSMYYSQESERLPDATFLPKQEASEDIPEEENSDAKASEAPKTEEHNGGDILPEDTSNGKIADDGAAEENTGDGDNHREDIPKEPAKNESEKGKDDNPKKENAPAMPSSTKTPKPEQDNDISGDNEDYVIPSGGSTFNESVTAPEIPIIIAGYPQNDESDVTAEPPSGSGASTAQPNDDTITTVPSEGSIPSVIPDNTEVKENPEVTEDPSKTEPQNPDDEYGDDASDPSEGDGAIADRLAKAEQHPDYNGQIIPPAIIEMFGEDKFIEWFDAIVDDPNFANLYTLVGFMDYCTVGGNPVEDTNEQPAKDAAEEVTETANDETVQEVTEVPDEDVSEEETEIPNDETAQETPEELSEKSADTDVASETDVSEQITE